MQNEVMEEVKDTEANRCDTRVVRARKKNPCYLASSSTRTRNSSSS